MNLRKIILLTIVLQFFYCLANAQIKLVGNITTSGVANYPTHIDSLGKGGYMSMPTTAARDAIPALRRKYGMLVFVEADNVIYKLNAATLVNEDWVTFSLGTTTVVDAGNLSGTTLKSTVINSSLTSVGTIASLTTGAITNSGKLIVGASSAASDKAVLEASSTTQGFLPPRMTEAQRDAIISPAAGLMIWNTTDVKLQVYSGSLWVNMNGITDQTLTIGKTYQGGKIFYILVDGDLGYDANVQHGLIAATSDQGTAIQWYNGSYNTTGVTGTAIGTGLDNTNKIIASQGNTGSYAAKLCRDFRGGGYTDWYLPSKDEIYKLYLNKTAFGWNPSSDGYYWTSTERDSGSALDLRIVSGHQSSYGKNTQEFVRAIRSF
jgi:hypothetical protein